MIIYKYRSGRGPKDSNGKDMFVTFEFDVIDGSLVKKR